MIQNGNEIEASNWGRSVEKAMRLALVRACSRDPEGLAIIESDAVWAVELSAYLTRRMMHTASRVINDTHNDKTRSNCLSCRNDIEGIGNRKSAIDMHEQLIHAHIAEIKKSFHQLELHQKMLFELIRSENT